MWKEFNGETWSNDFVPVEPGFILGVHFGAFYMHANVLGTREKHRIPS